MISKRFIAFSLLALSCVTLASILFRAIRLKGKGYKIQPLGIWSPLDRTILAIRTPHRHITFFMELLNQHRFIIAFAVMLVSSLCLLPHFNTEIHDDVRVYHAAAQDLLTGKLPYRDTVLEYPPYAIGIFLLPYIFPGAELLQSYALHYMMVTFLADSLVKLLLFSMFCRERNPLHALLPLTFYSLAVPFTADIFLQRFDIWPALICLLALWANRSSRHGLCGLVIALGVGVKLYPAIMVLPLFILALRQQQARRFVVGLVGGFLPLLLIGFVVPWWRFLAFQANRGLQVESLYAIILWMGRWFGFSQVNTVGVASRGAAGGWGEVHGPAAQIILPWARSLFILTVGISTLVASWAARQCQKPSAAQVARMLLLPLLGFIAFNQVLSPQFIIWLLPLAAVACSTTLQWDIYGILLATIFTFVSFHAFYAHYYIGFDFVQTIVLMLRNLILVVVWGALFWKLVTLARKRVSHCAATQVAKAPPT